MIVAMLATVVSHHWSGSCSAQPGRGLSSSIGDDAMSWIRPRMSTRAARVLCVPMSTATTRSAATSAVPDLDPDVLGTEVFGQAVVAQFEAQPALFPAGVGEPDVTAADVVHVHRAELEPLGAFDAGAQVTSVEIADQPEIQGVGPGDRLVQVLDHTDGRDRPEGLLAEHDQIFAADDHGGQVVEALAQLLVVGGDAPDQHNAARPAGA